MTIATLNRYIDARHRFGVICTECEMVAAIGGKIDDLKLRIGTLEKKEKKEK